MKKVIINADDYGLTHGVSEGIREALSFGVLRSTTAMMNMPGVETELETLLSEYPEAGVGVHLNITAGRPLLDPKKIPTIVREDGCFYSFAQLLERIEKVDPSDVAEEWACQIRRFRKICGRCPDHLDGHHHAMSISAELFAYYLKFAAENRCGIRCPGFPFRSDLIAGKSEAYRRFTLERIDSLLEGSDVWYPSLTTALYGENSTFENLCSLMEKADGITEVMCHPGHCDGDLRSVSTYNTRRETELHIMTDPALKDFLAERQIIPTNFRTEMS